MECTHHFFLSNVLLVWGVTFLLLTIFTISGSIVLWWTLIFVGPLMIFTSLLGYSASYTKKLVLVQLYTLLVYFVLFYSLGADIFSLVQAAHEGNVAAIIWNSIFIFLIACCAIPCCAITERNFMESLRKEEMERETLPQYSPFIQQPIYGTYEYVSVPVEPRQASNAPINM